VGPPNKIQQRALPFLLNGADIIAQAPPTQERIAAYVIPAIHIALNTLITKPQNRGPIVVIISTTVDQATQAQRMIRDLGGAIGVRSALGVGIGGDIQQETRLLQQNVPHILCGTPQKLHSLFTTPGGLPGNEVRFLVLDEVDQLIARNLHEFVFNIVKLLPPSRPQGSGSSSNSSGAFSPFPASGDSNTSPASGGGNTFANGSRRFPPLVHSPNPNDPPGSQAQTSKRQTALFSNTVPQDVLNLANAIQLRDPVRVLVRRDGNVTSTESHKNTGGGLKQFYLYLAFTATGGRIEGNTSGGGLGIIGSGRATQSSAETAQAKEWKLDALSDLFDDVDATHSIVHVGSISTLDAVAYKLASRGLDTIPLVCNPLNHDTSFNFCRQHAEMNPGAKVTALNKFRGNNSMIVKQQPASKVLVVFDVQVKSPDLFQVPLVINYG
jgi:translation initiation factor 4A